MYRLFSSFLKSFFKIYQNLCYFISCNVSETIFHFFRNLSTISTFLLPNADISFSSLIISLHKMMGIGVVAEEGDQVANMCHCEVKMEEQNLQLGNIVWVD